MVLCFDGGVLLRERDEVGLTAVAVVRHDLARFAGLLEVHGGEALHDVGAVGHIVGRRVLQQDIQGTFSKRSVNIQGTFSEHSGNIQGTFSKRSVNIQGTFSEHSGNNRGI